MIVPSSQETPMTASAHPAWLFVRCSDLKSRRLLWVDPSTNFIADAVTIARYGRTA